MSAWTNITIALLLLGSAITRAENTDPSRSNLQQQIDDKIGMMEYAAQKLDVMKQTGATEKLGKEMMKELAEKMSQRYGGKAEDYGKLVNGLGGALNEKKELKNESNSTPNDLKPGAKEDAKPNGNGTGADPSASAKPAGSPQTPPGTTPPTGDPKTPGGDKTADKTGDKPGEKSNVSTIIKPPANLTSPEGREQVRRELSQTLDQVISDVEAKREAAQKEKPPEEKGAHLEALGRDDLGAGIGAVPAEEPRDDRALTSLLVDNIDRFRPILDRAERVLAANPAPATPAARAAVTEALADVALGARAGLPISPAAAESLRVATAPSGATGGAAAPLLAASFGNASPAAKALLAAAADAAKTAKTPDKAMLLEKIDLLAPTSAAPAANALGASSFAAAAGAKANGKALIDLTGATPEKKSGWLSTIASALRTAAKLPRRVATELMAATVPVERFAEPSLSAAGLPVGWTTLRAPASTPEQDATISGEEEIQPVDILASLLVYGSSGLAFLVWRRRRQGVYKECTPAQNPSAPLKSPA